MASIGWSDGVDFAVPPTEDLVLECWFFIFSCSCSRSRSRAIFKSKSAFFYQFGATRTLPVVGSQPLIEVVSSMFNFNVVWRYRHRRFLRRGSQGCRHPECPPPHLPSLWWYVSSMVMVKHAWLHVVWSLCP